MQYIYVFHQGYTKLLMLCGIRLLVCFLYRTCGANCVDLITTLAMGNFWYSLIEIFSFLLNFYTIVLSSGPST